jgi:hypothetical protein
MATTDSSENLTRAPSVGTLWDGPDTLAVNVAKAALMEMGRADLARGVRTNRAGVPTLWHASSDSAVVAKAFLLGHQAAGHDAKLVQFEGEPAVDCQECYDRIEALALVHLVQGEADRG